MTQCHKGLLTAPANKAQIDTTKSMLNTADPTTALSPMSSWKKEKRSTCFDVQYKNTQGYLTARAENCYEVDYG